MNKLPRLPIQIPQFLKMFCALTGSMGLVSTGIFNATSGCILPQLLAENEDLYLTDDEASWFGEEISERL